MRLILAPLAVSVEFCTEDKIMGVERAIKIPVKVSDTIASESVNAFLSGGKTLQSIENPLMMFCIVFER
jgi:hypothetical protein